MMIKTVIFVGDASVGFFFFFLDGPTINIYHLLLTICHLATCTIFCKCFITPKSLFYNNKTFTLRSVLSFKQNAESCTRSDETSKPLSGNWQQTNGALMVVANNNMNHDHCIDLELMW